MKYFTSDLHLNHESILKYQKNRAFPNIELMNVHIINTINSVCTEKDELYILGDVLMGPRNKGIYLVEQLKPRLHLIRGNHDNFSHAQEETLFETVQDYAEVKENKHTIVCLHYPIERWNKCQYGVIHLHGHCHGDHKNILPNRFDIGWDVFPRPVSYDEVMSWKNKENISHH